MKAKHIKKLRKRIGAFDKFLIRESACSVISVEITAWVL